MNGRAAASGIGASLVLLGCTSTVTPPSLPEDPVTAFVLEEALHVGLVLPPAPGASGEAGEYVEFGFGDWDWYALGEDAWYDTCGTVLWPTQATLSRRTFGARSGEQLQRRAFWATLSPVTVARDDAAALRAQLQQSFDSRRREVVVQPGSGFRFVPVDRSYWLWRDCADEVAVWLRQLGCEVSWAPVRVGLAVAAPVDGG